MNKYDCSKTEDFAHEARRMCHFYVGEVRDCTECPMALVHCDIDDITPDVIKAVQKWSDEHPEKPKLSKKEYEFLSSFKKIDNRYICRSAAGDCYVLIPDMDCHIGVADDMFSFIQEGIGNGWSLEELLELEVEDE